MANRRSPTVEKSIEHIRARVRSREFAAGQVLPTEAELSALLNVSRGTVRNAIAELVRGGEILRTRHSRPVVTSPSQAKPGAPASEILVWLSRAIGDPISLLTLKGVSLGLRGSKFRMVVKEPTRFIGNVVASEERRALENLLTNDDIAGAIVQRDPFAIDSDLVAKLIQKGKHLVFIDSVAPDGIATDHVGTSNRAAARVCTEHLIDLGHSSLACIADCDLPQPNVDRIEGFRRAVSQANGELSSNVFVCSLLASDSSPRRLAGNYALSLDRSPYYHDLASRAVNAVLASSPPPTGLFICNDVLAYWICALLEGAGVRIPDDVSVVGFDWIAGITHSADDQLTSAAQDFEGFGRHAVDLLLDRISGGPSSPPRHVLLNAPLVIRSSTAHNYHLSGSRRAPSASGTDSVHYAHEK
jgi:DNA-binding LacI/PurR family transcriptional regulator